MSKMLSYAASVQGARAAELLSAGLGGITDPEDQRLIATELTSIGYDDLLTLIKSWANSGGSLANWMAKVASTMVFGFKGSQFSLPNVLLRLAELGAGVGIIYGAWKLLSPHADKDGKVEGSKMSDAVEKGRTLGTAMTTTLDHGIGSPPLHNLMMSLGLSDDSSGLRPDQAKALVNLLFGRPLG